MTDAFWGTTVPCADKWALFDSLRPDHHREAAAICATCPVTQVAACRALMRSLESPVGTWGGLLVGKPTPTRQSYPREHGTDRGYGQHRYRGERACVDCLGAHAARWRETQGAA